MKNYTTLLVCSIIVLAFSIVTVSARGGRGGGRGSIGSIFGTSRRKIFAATNSDRRKQPSSEKRYRGDREHLSRLKGNDISGNAPTVYQRHQFNYTPIMPSGGIYFRNHATMPPGAVYIPHTPQYTSTSKSSDFIDFFTGYMTGRILSKAFHSNQQINNNYQQHVDADKKSNVEESTTFWPTDHDVPLSPFNKSLLEDRTNQPTTEAFFKRQLDDKTVNISRNQQHQEKNYIKSPPGTISQSGIICMPMIFNGTDFSDTNKMIQVEKLVCFPAPPAPQPKDKSDCYETKTLLFPGDNNIVTLHCNDAKVVRTEPVVGDILDDDQIGKNKKGNQVDETSEDDI